LVFNISFNSCLFIIDFGKFIEFLIFKYLINLLLSIIAFLKSVFNAIVLSENVIFIRIEFSNLAPVKSALDKLAFDKLTLTKSALNKLAANNLAPVKEALVKSYVNS